MKFKTKIITANVTITVIAAATIYYIAINTINFTSEAIGFITIAAAIAAIIAMMIQYLLTLKPFAIINEFDERLSRHELDDKFTRTAFYTALYFPFYFMTISAVQWYLASVIFFILIYTFAHAGLAASIGATFAIVSGATIANILQYFIYQKLTEPVILRIQKHLKDMEVNVRKRLGIFFKTFVSSLVLILLFLILIKTLSNKFVGNILRANSITSARIDLAAYVPRIRSILSERLTPEQTSIELTKLKLGKSGFTLLMDNSYNDIFKISNNYTGTLPLTMLVKKDAYNDPMNNSTLVKIPVNKNLYLVGVYQWADYSAALSDFSKSQNWLLLTIALMLIMVSLDAVIDIYLPVKAIGSTIEKLTHGNFSASTGLFVEDEAGIAANSVRKMIADIRAVIKTIKSASSNIAEISDRMMGSFDHAKENILVLESEIKTTFGIISSVQGTLNQLTEYIDGLINSINDTIINCDNLRESIDNNRNTFVKIKESIDAVMQSNNSLSSMIGKLQNRITSNIDDSHFDSYSRLRTMDVRNEETTNEFKRIIESMADNMDRLNSEIKLADHYKHKTEDALNKSINTVSSLNDNVSRIVADLNKIDMVIDDTNLLAMNSSVISAQAGTSGRGFDVVSEEITKLANVTQTKILEVRSLTELLIKEKDTIISNINEKKKFLNTVDGRLGAFKEEVRNETNHISNFQQLYDNIFKAFNSISSGSRRLLSDTVSGKDRQHLIRTKLVHIDKGIKDINRHSGDFKSMVENIAVLWSTYTENLVPVMSELSTISEPTNTISGYMKIIKNKTLEIHGILERVSDISKELNKQLDSLNIRAEIGRISANINEEPERYRII